MDLVPIWQSFEITADIEEQAPTPERLLLYLLKHPLQRREDLALALCVPSSTISRQLCQLEEQGLLERVKASLGMSNASAWFYLTSKGIEACATLVGADAGLLAKLWGADEAHLLHLLPRLLAWLLLQNVINGLIGQAPHLLLPKEEPHARLRWHWQRDYTHSFVSKGKRTRCFADAVLVLSRLRSALAGREPTQQQEMQEYASLLFLLDTGLVGPHDREVMQERLHRLLLWRESIERQPHYRQFPPVLVLTHSARGRETWQWCAQQAAVQARLAPLEGAVLALWPETTSASAFSLNWQRLSSPGPCRLQDLLVTMPREAVPTGVLAPKAVPTGTFDEGTRRQRARRTLVKGQFAPRAAALCEALAHQSASRDSDEQTEVALLSLELSRRHLELLLLVYASPLLSGQELAVLMDLQAETVSRYLYDLRQWNCLASEPSVAGRRFSLAPRGLRFLAAQLCVPLTHLAESTHKRTKGPGQPDASSLMQRGVPALRRVIRHTSGLSAFIVRLCRSAQANGKQGHRLLWWETGARCARRYRYQGRWHNLLPDAQVAYQVGEHVVRAWIEWDEGTMKGRDLAIKLSAYRTWVLSREWQREAPILPLLLFIVPEPGQEGRVQRVARAILHATLQIYTTTVTRLMEDGPIEAIWLPVSPHKEGRLPERCSWLDLYREIRHS